MKRISHRIREAVARRSFWRKVLANRQANQRDLTRALGQVKRRLAARRAVRKTLGGGSQNRREQIADKIEEYLAAKDDLLERLDRVENKRRRARGQLRKARKDVARLRAHRKRIREDSEGRLTPNFHVAEFDTRDGTPVPKAAYPALKKWCEEIGEPLRKRYGRVTITSGHRHAAYNRSIGGATNSVHIYDYPGRSGGAVAVDHIVSGVAASTVANFEDPIPEASGLGRYASFTHSDNRHRIGWPRARWFG